MEWSTPGPALTSGLEWTAVVLNILFTIGIAKGLRAGWLFGGVASCIGVLLYALQSTWAMCALNGFYGVMAVYGWWSWGRAEEEHIQRLPLRFHLSAIPVVLLCTWGLSTVLTHLLNGQLPHLDAFITVMSVLGTLLMARRVLENWLWWVVGDTVSVYFNYRIGYDGYAILNVIYIVLSVAGFIRWRRQWRRQQQVGITP